MELYIILYYIIKFKNISFFYYTIQDIAIILQALLLEKYKYAWEIFKQLYIFDSTSANIKL